jgi:carboxyl-terminal processing protease
MLLLTLLWVVGARCALSAPPRPSPKTWFVLVRVDDPSPSEGGPSPKSRADFDRILASIADQRRFPQRGSAAGESLAGSTPPSLQKLRQGLREIAQTARPEDQLFLFWSTPVRLEPGETYWLLPSEGTPEKVPADGIANQECLDLLRRIRCRHQWVIVAPRLGESSTLDVRARVAAAVAAWSDDRRSLVFPSDGHGDTARVERLLARGLAGEADRDAGEADGWISAAELADFVLAENATWQRSGSDFFWVASNPTARDKLDRRRASLVALRDRGEIDDHLLAEGLRLFHRLPRFTEDRRLRQAYSDLLRGTITREELLRQVDLHRQRRTVDEPTAERFAAEVRNAFHETRLRHVHRGETLAALAEGCQALAEEFDALGRPEIEETMAEVLRSVSSDPTLPLLRFRRQLGHQSDLQEPAEAILLRRMLRSLDPYSDYLLPDEYRQVQGQAQGHLTGIGAVLEELPRERRLRVILPIPGGPAEGAGVVADDQIVSVDNVPTLQLGAAEASRRILGVAGSPVTLELLHPSRPARVVHLTRQDVPLETVVGYRRGGTGGWNYWLVEPSQTGPTGRGGIAYIRLTRFAADTAERLRGVLGELSEKGMSQLVLDLRFNPGGLLDPAVEVADLFLDAGVIVRLRDAEGTEQQRRAQPGESWGRPKVYVLINSQSASGSEIVAAALQDSQPAGGRATVAGSPSFGKGSLQEIVALPGGQSGLKVTSALFFRPGGGNLERFLRASEENNVWGVRPDQGWEMPEPAGESERTRGEMIRRQFLGVLGEEATSDPLLERVLARIRSENQAGPPPSAASNGSN